MYFLLLSSLLVARAVCTHHHHQSHPGRRVCGRDQLHSNAVVLHTESFVQPIHKPYIALCQGHRLCSTYRTEYRVAYRQVSRIAPSSLNSYPQCCPGWRRLHSHGCNQALCDNPCINGGTCVRPNQCACAPGWTGRRCQTDVDECSGSHHCSQLCLNTAGSYLCECREGHQLTEDRRSCHQPPSPPLPTPSAQAEPDHLRSASHSGGGAGATNNVTEEVRDLKSRVEMLEEKLNQALAPFNSLFPLSMEEGVAEKTSFLTHSFQQLDRIESLSEQIGFLEGRLETCSCQDN